MSAASLEAAGGLTPVGSGRLAAAVALGNALEVFDFTIFSFFSVYIAAAFFPARDALTSLLLTVATFGVGFLFRPLGALVIGAYADRQGRRAALTITIWLMAAGTAAIAFCPPFAVIGLWAPVTLVAGRLLQGFSAGGEIGPATAFLMESGPVERRGFNVSWQLGGQGAANLAGSASGLLLTLVLAKPDLAAWGWRIPFTLGLLIAPVGYLLRRALPDHPAAGAHAAPAREAVRRHWRTILLAIPIVMGSTVTTYVMIYFMPSFLIRIAGLPASTGFASSTASSVIILVLAPLCGLWLKPGTPRRMIVVAAYSAAAVSILPVFWLLTHHGSLPVVVASIAWITALMTVGSTASLIFLIERFPAPVRATAFGLVYALGVTVFGGSAQFVVTWLVAKTGSPMAAGGYVMLCEVLGVCGALLLREPRRSAERLLSPIAT